MRPIPIESAEPSIYKGSVGDFYFGTRTGMPWFDTARIRARVIGASAAIFSAPRPTPQA
jgi:hypothetical protein